MPAQPATIEKMRIVKGYQVGPNDVFCGHRMNWSGGNKRLGELVMQNMDRYNDAALDEKSEIASELLGQIIANGGKFLKEDKKQVVELSAKEAKTKIMQKFRDTKKALHLGAKKGDCPMEMKEKKKKMKRNSLPAPPLSEGGPPPAKRPALVQPTAGGSALQMMANLAAANGKPLSYEKSYSKKVRRLLPLASKKAGKSEAQFDDDDDEPSIDPETKMAQVIQRAQKLANPYYSQVPMVGHPYAEGYKAERDGFQSQDDTTVEEEPSEAHEDENAHAQSQFEDATESEESSEVGGGEITFVGTPSAIGPRAALSGKECSNMKTEEAEIIPDEPNAAQLEDGKEDESPTQLEHEVSAAQAVERGLAAAGMAGMVDLRQQNDLLAAKLQANQANIASCTAAAAAQFQMGSMAQHWQLQQQIAAGNPTQILPLMLQQHQHVVNRQHVALQESHKKIKLLEHVLALRDQEILTWHRQVRELNETGTAKDRELQKLRDALLFITTKIGGDKDDAVSQNSTGTAKGFEVGKLTLLHEQVVKLTEAAVAKDREILNLRQELMGVAQRKGPGDLAGAGFDSIQMQEQGAGIVGASMAIAQSGNAMDQELLKLKEAVVLTSDQLNTLAGAEALKDLTIRKLKEEIAAKDKRLDWLEKEKEMVMRSLGVEKQKEKDVGGDVEVDESDGAGKGFHQVEEEKEEVWEEEEEEEDEEHLYI